MQFIHVCVCILGQAEPNKIGLNLVLEGGCIPYG